MAVNEDCRHYVMRTTPGGERLERCKVDANEPLPFACPEGCVFYEPRRVSSAGWHVPKPTEVAEPRGWLSPHLRESALEDVPQEVDRDVLGP